MLLKGKAFSGAALWAYKAALLEVQLYITGGSRTPEPCADKVCGGLGIYKSSLLCWNRFYNYKTANENGGAEGNCFLYCRSL